MVDITHFDGVLACPRCDRTPLDRDSDSYRCTGCRVDFPLLDGIPWLFAEPTAALGDWRTRFAFSIKTLEREQQRLSRALDTQHISKLTRQRLALLAEASADHSKRLQNVLAPLQLDALSADYETYLALRTRLPSDQGLTTYYNNIHRDWCWGDEENELSFDIVRDSLSDTPPGRVLVLGAGAGRLAYDIHMRAGADATVVLDFNPLLLLLAQRITAGESIELYEFPIAPKNLDQHALLRTLRADSTARDGLHYVLADAHRPPFAKGSFDTVVTPWLIDILPERFETLCSRINHLLCDDGRWINFGSLSFHDADPQRRLSLEECVQTVAESGFGTPLVAENTIPYMCSPASRHGRQERVVSWVASKLRNAKRVERHEALPDWLVRGKEPVPLLESFQMQAISTRIHAFIMSLIDGQRSLSDMADHFAEQKLMTRDEAEPAIRSFLIKMYEDSQRSSGY